MNRVVSQHTMLVESRPDGDPILDRTFDLPAGARVLGCQTLRGDVVLFVESVDDASDDTIETVRRRFAIIEPAEAVPPGYDYVGTTVHFGGHLVLHVYEAPRGVTS